MSVLSLLIAVVAASNSGAALPQPIMRAAHQIVDESWTFKDGAPEQPAAFAQTDDGYLWLGAPSGLFRSDGVRFELFRPSFGDRLQSTNVSALLATRGGLWVGYVFGGFSFIKNGRVQNFVEATGSVTGFATARDGTVWAGATGNKPSGLWRFNGTTWHHIGPELKFPQQPVAQLGFDQQGNLWILTGFNRPDSAKQLYLLGPHGGQFLEAAKNLYVTSFTGDADGNVLTAPKALSGSSIEFEGSFSAYPILRSQSDQFLDRTQGVWLVSHDYPEVVLRRPAVDPLPQTIASASPNNSESFAIFAKSRARFVDREGGIWIGSDNGVHRLSYSPLKRQELPKWPAPWFALAPQVGGSVWVSAGDGNGNSSLYRVTAGTVNAQRPIAGVSGFAYGAPDGTFWFGGEGGLWHMRDDALKQVDLPTEMADRAGFIVTMTQEATGRLWLSFGGFGLYSLSKGTWTRYEGRSYPSPPIAKTRCPLSGVVFAYTDRLDRVWLGCTKSQLTLLDGEREQTFGPNDGLEVGNVTAISGRGPQIWIGGEFGLQQFDHGHFNTLHALDPQSLRGISGIVERGNGDLWLNGLGGIVHLRHSEILKGLQDPAYQVSGERFDRRAGLPGLPSQLREMPTAIEGTDGRLWFTVNNGVVWLDPTQADDKAPPPPVSIQSISADASGYELKQPLRFPAGTSTVEITYAAISLENPEAIRFRYKLREIDRTWQPATSTSVSYRSLPPRLYHFEVGATDRDGNWAKDTASLEFAILPAYYQTNWFRALCVLLMLVLAAVGYRVRIRRLQKSFEITLKARVDERTRIARELHDTLLQSFNGLLLQFATAAHLFRSQPDEAFAVLDNGIIQARRAIKEGREAVQGLRTSTEEPNDLAGAISRLAGELAAGTSDMPSADSAPQPIEIQVQVEGVPKNLHPIVRDETYRIAAEALRNAFEHSKGNRIEVQIRYESRQFCLRIRDNGQGIESDVLASGSREGHFGLRGMRERAELAGGKLTLWSAQGSGTEVELTIPASRAYGSLRSADQLESAQG